VTASPITQQPVKAKWILLNATTSGGGTAAVVASVGETADATHGAHLQPNVPILYPQNQNDPSEVYDLSKLQAYVPSGTTLTITYGI
jgi:hypothetical protein